MEEQALKCPGCGMSREDAWPATPAEAWEIRNRYASVPVKCMACSAASEAQTKYHTGAHDEHGIHFVVLDTTQEEIEEANG